MDASGRMIRSKFKAVSHLPCEELESILAATGGVFTGAAPRRLVLFDVREEAEFACSRIHQDAVHVPPEVHADPERVRALLPAAGPSEGVDVVVVCYCSIGYRSSQLADAIARELPAWAPFVHNLEGSIFRWANSGRTVVDSAGEPARTVHPYSALWGLLLNSELRGSM